MVKVEPPELLSVSPRILLLPVVTLPKDKLAGLDATVPGAAPVPLSDTFTVGLEAFEVIARFPLAAPLELGANVTLKVALCPPVNVTGNCGPLSLKTAPLALAAEIVTLAPPVFVTVSLSV